MLLLGASCAGGAINDFPDGPSIGGDRSLGERDQAVVFDAGPDLPADPDLTRDVEPVPPETAPPPPDTVVPPQDAAPPPDTAPFPDLAPTSPNIGAICTDNTACHNGAECLLMITDTVGICTMACTPDDPQTTGNEDSCPDQARNVCGKIPLSSGTTQSFCLQRCNPRETGNDCPSQLACQPTSTFITGQLAVAACVFPACQTGADCPVYTNKICNPTTLLGCSAGEQCEVIGASGRCAVPGKCLTASGLCGAHTQGTAAAKVGGPCTADTDCGNGMFCLNETTDGGKVFRRNGYCTIAGCAFGGLSFAACPSGSTCGRLYTPGLCLRSCSLTSAVDCRGVTGDKLGDYECYAWNNFTIGTGGQLVAASPVCDTPVGCTLVPCASLGTSDGVTPNATNMTCRSPATNTTVSDTTAGAVCLDDTASGPLY